MTEGRPVRPSKKETLRSRVERLEKRVDDAIKEIEDAKKKLLEELARVIHGPSQPPPPMPPKT